MGSKTAHLPNMADERIRRQIAFLAAQMMYNRTESEYFTAKRKAAKQLGVEYRHRPGDLPSNKEIRDQIQAMARIHEGPKRLEHLRDMRLDALRLMRLLARFRPRLIGSVRTGHVRKGSDIDIHIFCDSLALVTDTLDELGLQYDVEHKRIVKYGEERTFTHIHIFDNHNYELTLYAEDKAHYVFKSSITGKAIERASIAELEALLKRGESRARPRGGSRTAGGPHRPLHPVPDAARAARGGEAEPEVPPRGRCALPQPAGLRAGPRRAALRRGVPRWPPCCTTWARRSIRPTTSARPCRRSRASISERTAWLIEHHMETQAYKEGTLGARARVRLQNSEWFEDLMLLNQLDRRGRMRGAVVCELEEALEYIRRMNEDSELIS